MITIPMRISTPDDDISVRVASNDVEVRGGLSVVCNLGPLNVDIYDDEIVFTPVEEEQVVLTAGKFLQTNITINPIPSNYGLITWNGSTIRVS